MHTNSATPPVGQLAEKEAGKWQLHQKTFVESLAQHATEELVVEGKVLVEEVSLK